jgi:hypothetical protein
MKGDRVSNMSREILVARRRYNLSAASLKNVPSTLKAYAPL